MQVVSQELICPSSWQLQLAWQHFILQTNGKCKGSENYKFSVHVVAKTLDWAGGSQSYFAGCKRTIAGSRTAHLTSAFRNAFFSRLISLFNGKNGDNKMLQWNWALTSKNPSSKLLFHLNTLCTTISSYHWATHSLFLFPLVSRTNPPENVLSHVKLWTRDSKLIDLAPRTADCNHPLTNLAYFGQTVHFWDESVSATTEHDWSLQCQVSHVYHDMKTPTPHNKDVFPEQKLVPNMQSSRERMCRWRKSRKQELVLWEKVKPQAKCRFSQRASTAAQDLLEKNMRHQRCCCRTASCTGRLVALPLSHWNASSLKQTLGSMPSFCQYLKFGNSDSLKLQYWSYILRQSNGSLGDEETQDMQFMKSHDTARAST